MHLHGLGNYGILLCRLALLWASLRMLQVLYDLGSNDWAVTVSCAWPSPWWKFWKPSAWRPFGWIAGGARDWQQIPSNLPPSLPPPQELVFRTPAFPPSTLRQPREASH